MMSTQLNYHGSSSQNLSRKVQYVDYRCFMGWAKEQDCGRYASPYTSSTRSKTRSFHQGLGLGPGQGKNNVYLYIYFAVRILQKPKRGADFFHGFWVDMNKFEFYSNLIILDFFII